MLKIAIVGRPNVGKSTLFNRIIGYRKAITENVKGVTRDYIYGEFEYRGKRFSLIDTGGFDPLSKDLMFLFIKEKVEKVIDETDLILFVLDGKEGLLPLDIEIAETLRKKGKPFLCVVNKVEGKNTESQLGEFYSLGVERLYPVSALHGKGIDELLSAIAEKGKGGEEKEKGEEIRIAIIGRPNTGKSSILNRILGTERMIVSEIPGTTRDAVDSRIIYDGKEVVLIDTAGIRRKNRVSHRLEVFSIAKALKAIERAHVVNLIIDAMEGATHQDGSLVHLIVERGKGLNIIVNKWDLLEGKIEEKTYIENMKALLPHASFSPFLLVSAKTGKNIEKILKTNLKTYEEMKKSIKTSLLTRSLREFQKRYSISLKDGKEIKIFYANQIKSFPPTFLLFTNTSELPEHYKRFLENSLRKKFGFEGVPIRLFFKRS